MLKYTPKKVKEAKDMQKKKKTQKGSECMRGSSCVCAAANSLSRWDGRREASGSDGSGVSVTGSGEQTELPGKT